MDPKNRRRGFRHSLVLVCLGFAVLLSAAPALRAQAGEQVDPFYQRLFDESKTNYELGNFAAVVQNMEIAAFGFGDSPDRLLACYIYLELAHYGLKDEDKARIYDEKIRLLNAQNRVDSLKLPESIVSKYKTLRDAFDRRAGRTSQRPPDKTTVTPPVKKEPAPSTKTEPAPSAKIQTTPSIKIRNDISPAAKAPVIPPDYLAMARQETDNNKRIVFYKRAIQDNPNNIDIYFELDDAYNKAKKYRDGAALIELLLKYYPENIPARLRLAQDWLADRSFNKALQSLTASLKMEPEHIGIHYLLGLAYIGQKKYKEALAELDIVLARDPVYKEAEVLRKLCADRIK